MKKLLCLLMVLSFAVAAFAGCGPRPSSPDAASQISQSLPPKPSSSAPSSSEASSAPSSSAPASSTPASSKPVSSRPSGSTGGTVRPPASSAPAPLSTTTIKSGNTYSDKTYGNLLIHSDVEDDIVTLQNIKITGTLIIEGSTQIELVDSTINAIELNRYGSAVTITAQGKTTVNTIHAKSNVVLDETALSSGYKGFKKLTTSDNPYYYFIDVVLEDTHLESAVLNTRTQITQNGSSHIAGMTNKNNLYTYEPSSDGGGGGGGGGSSYSSRTINTAGAVLNGGTYSNVTITSEVGSGEVTLKDVRILGTLYIHGGGSDSIILAGSTSVPHAVINTYQAPGAPAPSLRAIDATVMLGSITVSSPAHTIVLSGAGTTNITLVGSVPVQSIIAAGPNPVNINLGTGGSVGSTSLSAGGNITGTGSVGAITAPAGTVTVSSTVQAPAAIPPAEMPALIAEAAGQTIVKLKAPQKLVGISFRWNDTILSSDKITYTDAPPSYTLTVPAMTSGGGNTLIVTAPGYQPKTLPILWYAPSQKASVTFGRDPIDLLLTVKKGGVELQPEADGSYKLEPGEYSYTATKPGYVPKQDIVFNIAQGELTKTIPVSLRMAVDTISINGATTVVVGKSIPLLVSITPPDAHSALLWTALDPHIATVSSEGVVTGVAVGAARVQVQDTLTGKSTVATLKVSPAVSSVSIEGPVKVNVGDPIDLTVTVKPEGANGAVTWSSADETIATVINGRVTGKAVGSVEIIAASVEDYNIVTRYLISVVDTSAPTVGTITASDNQNYIKFAVSDNVAVTKVEVDATIFDAAGQVLVQDFDFNFSPSLGAEATAQAASYGMTVINNDGIIQIKITDYDKFYNAIKTLPGYPTVNSGEPPKPHKIHFWVVAHDAAGNRSGHMGDQNLPATAAQVDLKLSAN